jgi:tripartite-type tricarboxylate transporter receptor subunit TctC
MTPRSLLVVSALGLSFAAPAAICADASPNGFPDRPIRFIVPFPPGGSNDVLSRFVGLKLTDRIGTQIVIDNRAGANGIIGTDLAAHTTPDGYTMLMVSTSYVMNAAVRKLPYDVVKSFDPVATIASSPNCIVVHPGFVKSVSELVERAKAKPASIFYASTGIGGFNHFGGELFKKIAGVNLVMVPYKGGGPAMTDVMGGQIPAMFSSVTQVLPHARSGRLRVLAVGGSKRSAALPDVPTVAEAGYPGYEVYVWWGIVTPAGVPAAARKKLRDSITAVLDDPETLRYLERESAEPMKLEPAAFRKMIQEDVKKWTVVAKEAQIKVE